MGNAHTKEIGKPNNFESLLSTLNVKSGIFKMLLN